MIERQWSKHYRDVWSERAANSDLPGWLRVATLAYGKHRANGHATFHPGSRSYGPGDIALVLGGGVDHRTGEIRSVSPQHVRRAIDTAVKHGWLAPGSNAKCLIVPHHAVEFGMGNAYAPCPVDHTSARRRHDREAVQLEAA